MEKRGRKEREKKGVRKESRDGEEREGLDFAAFAAKNSSWSV